MPVLPMAGGPPPAIAGRGPGCAVTLTGPKPELLRRRAFNARHLRHAVTQGSAVGGGTDIDVHLRRETMITTRQALSNARIISEGTGRIQDAIAAVLRGQDGDSPPVTSLSRTALHSQPHVPDATRCRAVRLQHTQAGARGRHETAGAEHLGSVQQPELGHCFGGDRGTIWESILGLGCAGVWARPPEAWRTRLGGRANHAVNPGLFSQSVIG